MTKRFLSASATAVVTTKMINTPAGRFARDAATARGARRFPARPAGRETSPTGVGEMIIGGRHIRGRTRLLIIQRPGINKLVLIIVAAGASLTVVAAVGLDVCSDCHKIIFRLPGPRHRDDHGNGDA
jgi:hypothetical protein